MKRLSLTLWLAALCGGVCAQQNAWENPAVTGTGRELPRTQLMSYSSAEGALAGDAAGSLWIAPVEPEWTQQTTPEGTVFRTRYKMPFKWVDRQLFLRIPSAAASYAVSVNGQRAGYTQQSRTAVEFDVTGYSKEGYNDVEILIFRSPAVKVLENYDHPVPMAHPEGVCVLAQPKIRVRDLVVDAACGNGAGQLNLGVVVKSHLLNEKQVRIHYELRQGDKVVSKGHRDAAFSMRGEDTVRFFEQLYDARPWSAETPTLYTLLVKVQQQGRYLEYVSFPVGFRTVGAEGSALTANGEPIPSKMADFTPSGDLQRDRERIETLKKSGVTLLRLLPRPESEAFYAMCDQIGVYLCDQAGIDTHLAGDSRQRGANPTNDPAWRDAYADRALAMFHNSRNHPSVVMFSLADRSSNGYNLYESYRVLKAAEPVRPVIYLGAEGEWNSDADVTPEGKLTLRQRPQ